MTLEREEKEIESLVASIAKKEGISEALKAEFGVPGKYFEENFLGKGGTAEHSYGNCLRFSASSEADDDAAWVAAMNNIANRAREIVWNEITQ